MLHILQTSSTEVYRKERIPLPSRKILYPLRVST